MYTKNFFSVEGFENEIFEGIHENSRRWNGWAMPLFNLDNAKKIIASQDLEDCVKFEMSYYEISEYPKGVIERHADGVEFYRCVILGGVEYYKIGFMNWTWEIAHIEETENQ